jgi:hypothetical protein
VPTPVPTPLATPASGPYPPDTTLAYVATPPAPLPGYLAPFTDPTWGTRITRVTSIAGVRNIYSRISAWNCDGTKLLLGFNYPGRMLDGRTYADLGSFNQVSGAVWSNTDPNKLFGVSSASNVLYAQNATTGALTVLHVFTGYATSSIGGWGGISIGDGEGGVDDTDTYIALMAQTSAGTQHIITYNLRTDTIVADIAVPNRPNNVQISRRGNYVVVVDTTLGFTRVYPRDLSSSIELYGRGYHGDNALDANGNEIFVANNAPLVKAFRLSDGAATQLLPGATAWEYGHVSGRNISRPGWIYLSVYDNTVTSGRTGHDQLVAVKTDGSGTVEVFGFSHHQNIVYGAMPMAVPAPDGRRVLFGSEWDASAVYSYVAGQ